MALDIRTHFSTVRHYRAIKKQMNWESDEVGRFFGREFVEYFSHKH